MSAALKTVMIVTRATCLVACATLLSACSGSGSVNVGSGQSPDPATVDFPIFYVKRTIPEDTDDLRQLRDAVPDADLFMRDRASPSAPETNITGRVTGDTDLYDIKDLNVSPDGLRLAFAMRGPLQENMDEEDGPTWNIWAYDIASDELQRVITSDTVAEEGQDVAPAYLADGRIVFSSTRQRQSKAILTDEGKPPFEAQGESSGESAFVLHVMPGENAQLSDIRQISFNQSHDLNPTLLLNGRILWSRWDNAPGSDGIHLYTVNPDGSDLQLHYGANSHGTGTDDEPIEFVGAREMESGNLLALIRERTDVDFGGDLVIIDASTYVENTQPTLANAGMSGPAQTRATPNDVRTVPGPSPGGRFHSGFPLWDGTNRILVTWSQCRVLDESTDPATIVPCTDDALENPDVELAPVLYSVWMFDPEENTLQPIMQPEEGVMYSDVVAAQPRAVPQNILDRVANVDFDGNLATQAAGILDIKSVYDFDGVDTAPGGLASLANGATLAQTRPARFIRLEKAVSQADDDMRDIDGGAFGATGVMREILGYAPVEPDGSVRMKVPADVAFQISILDSNGRRISPTHSSWLQVRAGEVLACNGCHTPATPTSPRSHGRMGLSAAINTGAAGGAPFPGTNPLIVPTAGETMAQARARFLCETSPTPACTSIVPPALEPSVNVLFEDQWSTGRAPDPDISYSYLDASFTTEAPTSDACSSTWNSRCRIVINYAQHIQPLWDEPRLVLDPGTGATLADNTCSQSGCHNRQDAMGAPQVPGGQLDLSAEPSDEETLQPRSYRELLFTDNEQQLNITGGLEDVCAQLDPDTGVCIAFVGVGPYLNAGAARGGLSSAFLSRFEPGSGSTHAGFLSPSELRLLSEWLDIGAQNFNNPFDPALDP
jgi:hypothetical protein